MPDAETVRRMLVTIDRYAETSPEMTMFGRLFAASAARALACNLDIQGRAMNSETHKMNLTSGLVGAETKGPIGWLIWDNPTKLNALSPGMYEDALSVIEAYEADPAIKVVIMRGAGTKAFISGGDISSFDKTRANAEVAKKAREAPTKLRLKMLNMEKPFIAMIYGYCLGGGLGMALNADMRFASIDSQFSVPAALRGIAYAPEGLKSLVDLVGPWHCRGQRHYVLGSAVEV